MKLLIAFSLIALTLTTGFTCAKNTPEAANQEAPAADPSAQPSQEQMATPPADGTAAPEAPAADSTTEEKK